MYNTLQCRNTEQDGCTMPQCIQRKHEKPRLKPLSGLLHIRPIP